MTPLDFAYRYYGRYVAPDSRTAWLYKKGRLLKGSAARKAGDLNSGMGGTVVWIGESGARVYGPDYPDEGYRAHGDSGEGRRFVISMCQKIPTETWMAVIFGKPGADPNRLVLNGKGGAVTAYYDTKRGVATFYPKVLQDAAAGFEGLSISEAADVLSIVADMRAAALYSAEIDPKALARLEKLRAKCPNAERAAGSFLRAGTMRPGVLKAYLKETRDAA